MSTKVSELTAASAATTDDLLYLVDGANSSKKITFANLQASVDHTQIANKGTNTHAQIDTHIANNNQAHSDYLKNDANDTSSGKITAEGFETTGDRSSADTAYVPMVLYNTDDTPPAASGFPIGTIYIKYTA